MSRKRNIQIGIALGILVVASIAMTTTGVGYVGTAGSTIQINPNIPIPPTPTLPTGFTKQQVQAAKDIAVKEKENATKKLTESGVIQSAVTQHGDGSFFVTWPVVYTTYNVNSFYRCNSCPRTYPDLAIPLKIEVWNNNFQSVGGYQSAASGAWVYTSIFYWNYELHLWSFEDFKWGNTDYNGITRSGFIIPYGRLSDKYYIIEYVYNNGQWQQADNKFFTVNWY